MTTAWADPLELLVEVLSRSEGAELTQDEFYARLCEVICQMGGFRRAVIFRYDHLSHRVRAVGTHGLDLPDAAIGHITVESAPLTAEAVRKDDTVEVSGDLRPHFPPELAELVQQPARMVCTPISAADRTIGVMLAERALTDPPLTQTERQMLWALGKAIALATTARIVANQRERAKQLEGRIDLAREVHDGVIQRLFGVSMALDGPGDLPAAERQLCVEEMQGALSDLRTTMQRPLGRSSHATNTTFDQELARLAEAHPDLHITLTTAAPAQVPAKLEPLAQSVLHEAVRNVAKHAQPSSVEVGVHHLDGSFVIEIVNDGVNRQPRTPPGLGLRLAAFEALQTGGMLEFGPQPQQRWRVKLMVPTDPADATDTADG